MHTEFSESSVHKLGITTYHWFCSWYEDFPRYKSQTDIDIGKSACLIGNTSSLFHSRWIFQLVILVLEGKSNSTKISCCPNLSVCRSKPQARTKPHLKVSTSFKCRCFAVNLGSKKNIKKKPCHVTRSLKIDATPIHPGKLEMESKIGRFCSFSIGWFLGSMLIFQGVPETSPKQIYEKLILIIVLMGCQFQVLLSHRPWNKV